MLSVVFGEKPEPSYWGRWKHAYASELVGTEARRVIDRLRLEGVLDQKNIAAALTSLAEIERSLHLVEVSHDVLRRASAPMSTAVKTLDAVHLATALVVRELDAPRLRFATYDRQQQRAAAASDLALAPTR